MKFKPTCRTGLGTGLLATALALAIAGPAHAGLVISTNADTVAGRDAFLAAGTTQTLFDWNAAFAPGSFTPGALGPLVSLASITTAPLPDGSVNTAVGANGVGLALALGNWIDGGVFDEAGSAAADLAINGIESFNLFFGRGHRSIGLAVSSGAGNLPAEVDLTGALFDFRAFDDLGAEVGVASLSLAAGRADQQWLTVTADREFRRIEVRERGAATIADQYFSNIHTSVEAVGLAGTVPVPGSLALVTLGLGLAARQARRARATAG